MNEVQYLADYYRKFPSRHSLPAGGQDEPVETVPYEPTPVGSYEVEHGTPYVVDKLGIKADYSVDSDVEIKVMAIDQYIKNTLQDEGLRDSVVSYDTILARMLGRLGTPIEQAKRQGKGLGVLEVLFQEVALTENKSGVSFLQEIKEKFMQAKAEFLKMQLRETLSYLKNV